MGIITDVYNKLGKRLSDKYNVEFPDENIPRSRNRGTKRLALASVALLGVESKLKKIEKLHKGMVKQINDLQTADRSEITGKVEDIVKTQDKIIGKSAEALNYLGEMGSTEKYQIGSASIVIRPWLNWKSIKVNSLANFFRKVPIPISAPLAMASKIPIIGDLPIFSNLPLPLKIPVPVYEAAATAGFALKEKRELKKQVIYGDGDNTKRKIDEVVKYDNKTGELKVNKKLLNSLTADKALETVLNGTSEATYEPVRENTPNITEIPEDKLKIDLNKEEEKEFKNYEDTENFLIDEKYTKPLASADDKEFKNYSSIQEEKNEEPKEDVISSADDLLDGFDREEAKKQIEDHTSKTKIEEPIVEEEVAKPETEPVVETKPEETEEKSEDSKDNKLDMLFETVKSLYIQISKLTEKVNALTEENEKLKSDNTEPVQETEYQGTHFYNEETESQNENYNDQYEGRHFIYEEPQTIKVKPTLIKKEDLKEGTTIIRGADLHKDDDLDDTRVIEPITYDDNYTPVESRWKLQK